MKSKPSMPLAQKLWDVYDEWHREQSDSAATLITASNLIEQDKAELLELLTLALPYVEEGELFNAPHKKGLSKQIRAAIRKAKGEA